MKIAAYAVAVLAAVGIMIALVATPTADETSAAPASASLISATPMTQAGELILEVPGMHCQFSCYPSVEKALESEDAVAEVKLAEQPDPNALTVKRVIVRYDEGFNLKTAIEKLEAKGFAASVVQ